MIFDSSDLSGSLRSIFRTNVWSTIRMVPRESRVKALKSFFCGQIWTQIGGNQVDAFADLPIHLKALDSHKEGQRKAKDAF